MMKNPVQVIMANVGRDWKEIVDSIRDRNSIDILKVDTVRNLISRLTVACFFEDEYGSMKPRGLWQREKPIDWPSGLPFQDPHNKGKGDKKLKRRDLVQILVFLVKRYKRQNGDAHEFLDTPITSSSSSPSPAPTIADQPLINPEFVGFDEPRAQMSVEVSQAEDMNRPAVLTNSDLVNVLMDYQINPENMEMEVIQEPSEESSRAESEDSATRGSDSNLSTRIIHEGETYKVIERLKASVKTQVGLQPSKTVDILRAILTSRTLKKKCINKTVLKLFYEIQYFVELDEQQREASDKQTFQENVVKLNDLLNGCEETKGDQSSSSDSEEEGSSGSGHVYPQNPDHTYYCSTQSPAGMPVQGIPAPVQNYNS